MLRISVLLLLSALAGITAQSAIAAGSESTASSKALDSENTLYLDLEYGRVVIRMRPDLAPNHVRRIKHLVRAGFFDGMVFHRVLDGFMAQTGDPKGNGTGGSGRMLKAEFTRTPQLRGVVSMARASGKDSADSQFFIVLADSRPALDGKYTAWAEVASGMEFVDMIHKGDTNRNGAVRNPDRLVRLQVAADADRPPTDRTASADLLKAPDVAATARDFTGEEFRCVALNNGLGVAPQAALAQLWAHGYLAGRFKAQNVLSFTNDPADTSFDAAVRETCMTFPAAFLWAVASQELAKTPRQLPPATAAFSPATYTCRDYVAARSGANGVQGDMADLWGFAFIQGYKNVDQPKLEMPFEVRPQLVGAVAAQCEKNPAMGFLDLVALVAAKVKLK